MDNNNSPKRINVKLLMESYQGEVFEILRDSLLKDYWALPNLKPKSFSINVPEHEFIIDFVFEEDGEHKRNANK